MSFVDAISLLFGLLMMMAMMVIAASGLGNGDDD